MTGAESPRLAATERSGTAALAIGLLLAMLGFLLWNEAQNKFSAEWGAGVEIPHIVGYLAASLFVAAAGLIASGLVVLGRLRAIARSDAPMADDKAEAEVAEEERPAIQVPQLSLAPEWLAGWPQVVATVLLGACAFAAVITTWTGVDQHVLSPKTQQILGGILVLLAFPFLVLDRVYANKPPQILPDAPQIERLLRVPLVSFTILGIARVLLSLGFAWPSLLEELLAVVIAVTALELVLRGCAMLFVPFAPIDTRRSTADSAFASLLRLTPPTLSAVGTAVKRQFGVDLSRSWALAFVRRALFPVTLGMIALAWLVTGVTTLGFNERAVYERLGVPVAVLGPGLHLHLPWPFGVMRHVELGVVHEIPIIFPVPGEQTSNAIAAEPIPQDTDIEGLAPISADRLWDTQHPSEASYLIASESQGKQSFQIVNVDLRVVYRIGPSDAAAKDAAYATADPEALIQAMGGQRLVRYFARYTLLDVLGQSRERFANDFRTALQAGLDELSTGIDVIAVVVEAIHPPPGAAKAFHDVQAAEVYATSQIALRQADAITAKNSAEQAATETRNEATAGAAEIVNHAQADTALFTGDRQAYRQDGQVFLFERWLDRLSGSLPKSSFILLDHRLTGAAAPTIDFRNFSLPGASYRTSPAAPIPSVPKAPAAPPPQSQSESDEDEPH